MMMLRTSRRTSLDRRRTYAYAVPTQVGGNMQGYLTGSLALVGDRLP